VLLNIVGVRLAIGHTLYQSTVRVKLERDLMDASVQAGQRGTVGCDPYFIQTEFELIQSEVILGKVIDDLNLNTAWGAKYAGGGRLKTMECINLLKARLHIRPVRNTSLIEIRVYDEKAEEAARIANAIAEAYRAHRFAQNTELSKGGIRPLEERLAEQEERIKQAQQKVEKLRAELKINDVPASADSPAPLMTADALRKLESLRIEMKVEYDRQVILLTQLKEIRTKLRPESLAQAITTALPDTLLNALLEQLSNAEQRLATLPKEYGPEHSEVVKAKGQIEDLHSKIKERTDGIILGLEVKVHSLSNGLDNLNQQASQAVTNDILRASQTRPYFEAKRNLDEPQRFRQILEMKIANEQVEVTLPKSMMVQIVDRAIPALQPISPNRPRALAIIALGVLVDVAGLGLLLGAPRLEAKPTPA